MVFNLYMGVFTVIVVGTYLMAIASKALSSGKPGYIGQPKPNYIMGFIIPSIVFSVFSGLRNTIGDTGSYIHSFELVSDENPDVLRFRIGGNELFSLLQDWLKKNGYDAQTLIMIAAIFTCVGAIYVIYKYAHPFELGICLFVLTGYYSLSMNGMRQYFAAGILLLGTKYLLSEKWTGIFKYLPFIFIAWMIHSSALIMIPIFFVIRRKAWSLSTMAMLMGSVAVAALFDSFLPSFLEFVGNTDYSNYASNGWFTSGNEIGSNIIRVVVLAIPLIIGYLNNDRLSFLGKINDMMVNLSIINICFYILSLYNWIFARFAIYTSIYALIYLTWIVSRGFDREDGKNVYWVSIICYSAYFYYLAYTIIGYRSDYF